MKTQWRDLALFGGEPEFREPRHVGCPNLGNRTRLHERLDEILDRRWLSNGGPMVEEFERRIATTAGVHHAVTMSNATIALELVLRGLKLQGKVLLPSCTFIATAHSVRLAGLTPVFCDVDPRTANLCPDSVRENLDEDTAAILGVHLFGRATHVEELESIAEEHRIPLLFDAAHALGCTYRGRRVGSLGRAEVFSFHATKFVNSFEGGAVVTNDERLAGELRRLRNFGFDGAGDVVGLGTNAKMNEMSAAMGLTSLDAANEFMRVNAAHYHHYRDRLSSLKGLCFLEYDPGERSNFQYVVLLIDERKVGMNRDELLRVLTAENALVRSYFHPGAHRAEPYRSRSEDNGSLKATDWVLSRTLCLPTGTGMGDEDVDRLCDLITLVVENAPAIQGALSSKSLKKKRGRLLRHKAAVRS